MQKKFDKFVGGSNNEEDTQPAPAAPAPYVEDTPQEETQLEESEQFYTPPETIPIPVGQVPSEDDDDVLRELPGQKTEDVPHSAPDALPEVSERGQGEINTQGSTSPHGGDQHMSLHDAVAASTKPGNTEEDIFPIVLDSPTKGANLEEAFPSDQDNIGVTYIHPTVESATANFNDFVDIQPVEEHDGSSMILDASAYPGRNHRYSRPDPSDFEQPHPDYPHGRSCGTCRGGTFFCDDRSCERIF